MPPGPPLFTIVCPVVGQPQLFPHLLWAVLQQTVEDWELLVLEDGHRPMVRQCVAHLHERVPEAAGVVTLVPADDAPARTRNPLCRRGLELARGRYVCWAGHDTLLHPMFLQAHRDNFRGRPEAVSLVNVDYFQAGAYYMGKTPRGWRGLDALEAGDLDLLNVCVPTREARDAGFFAPAHDALPNAWWPSLQALLGRLPVAHVGATVAARF